MFLDESLKNQLKEYLSLLQDNIAIHLCVGSDDASQDCRLLIDEILSVTDKIAVEHSNLSRMPSFKIAKPDGTANITFAGTPLGHEFSSLVLALLQSSGRPPKVEAHLIDSIKKIDKTLNFEIYVSLSCHNCPEVVQALNLMGILNPNITSTVIDGGIFRQEIEDKDIMAVPCIYLNGEFFAGGRITLEEILEKLGNAVKAEIDDTKTYDVLIVGGGPAGASAAIYSARKNLRTAILTERFGGQVNETLGIENFIGIPHLEGPNFVAQLENHVKAYEIDIIKSQKANSLRSGALIEVELEDSITLKSKTVIITTGARWRNLNIPGELEFKNKGVAYCPHCDGPVFKGKNVAVVGGGNSGVEAALDLASIASHVTLLEFLPELKADTILQERLYKTSNVTVLRNVQVTDITGVDKVKGIMYKDRATNEQKEVEVQGVFILIGLMPNTEWVKDIIERNSFGEIVVDKRGATSLKGVFAAGDCTDSPYKQIIISMGSGATSALSAFEYILRSN